MLLLAAAVQGTVGHGCLGTLARFDDPVVSVRFGEASFSERHPVIAALLVDPVGGQAPRHRATTRVTVEVTTQRGRRANETCPGT